MQTLQFAWDGMSGTEQLIQGADAAQLKAINSAIGTRVEMCMGILGIAHVGDTIVGDDMLRGVSGGQKKRVTLGELLMGPQLALFADEISTGLDSATTFDIMSACRAFCHTFQSTSVVSLLQPSPETLALFDDILLLDRGQIVYHGPRDRILPFFEGMGFQKPPFKDLADFLQEVTTKEGQSNLIPTNEIGKRGLPTPPSSTSEFAERFRETDEFKATLAELAAGPTPMTAPIPNIMKVGLLCVYTSCCEGCQHTELSILPKRSNHTP